MEIDPRIREAIEVAVEEGGQDASLSRKLVAWFEALSSGNERIDDAERYVKLLYDSTMSDVGGDESDDERSPNR